MRVARVLTTSVTAAALAFSMLASAIPANAALPGYHAAYFSESSFLALAPGQTGQFSVGFTNTGDQAWVKGSAASQASLHTQVPSDNTVDFNAGWASGWTAPNIYAVQSNDLVAPGQVGFFVYNVVVPSSVPPGLHYFYGRESVDGAGGYMEDYGYYQVANVQSSAITITGSTPPSPATNMTPVISGTGANAASTVTVSEGTTTLCTAVASSTGTWSCQTTALGAGSHTIVASAPGQGTSAPFTYVVDLGAPSIVSVTTPGLSRVTVCFTKAMSKSGVGDYTSTASYAILGFTTSPGTNTVAGVAPSSDSTCATLTLANSAGGEAALTNNGTYTLQVSNVQSASGNTISPNPSTFSFTATDTTVPTVLSISQPGTYSLIVNFSEPIDPTTAVAANFRWDSANFPGNITVGAGSTSSNTRDTQVRLDFCGGTGSGNDGLRTGTGSTPTTVCTVAALPANGTHALDVNGVKDLNGNVIVPNPTSFSVNIIGTNDTVRPTVSSAAATQAVSSGVLVQRVTVTYSEGMKIAANYITTNAINNTANYSLSNPDGSTATGPSTANGTGGCASTSGSSLTVGSASMDTSNSDRFQLKAVRLTISGGFFANGCAYILTVSNVQDQAANNINPNPTITTVSQTADTTAPTVLSASSSPTQLTVVYSEDISATATGATTASNYTSTNTTFQTSLSGMTCVVNNDNVSVTCTYATTLAAGTYPLHVANVKDNAGNVMTPQDLTVSFSDSTSPTLVSVTVSTSGGNASINVTYSESMTGGATPANSAGNTTNYSINNSAYGTVCASGTANITANSTAKVFVISCTGGTIYGNPTSGQTITVTVRNVADQSGNVISPNPSSGAGTVP